MNVDWEKTRDLRSRQLRTIADIARSDCPEPLRTQLLDRLVWRDIFVLKVQEK